MSSFKAENPNEYFVFVETGDIKLPFIRSGLLAQQLKESSSDFHWVEYIDAP